MAADPLIFVIQAERDLTPQADELGREFARIASLGTVGETDDAFYYLTSQENEEIQGIADDVFSLAIDATGGTFKLVYNSAPSANIAFDADADAILAALGPLVGTQNYDSSRYNAAVWSVDDSEPFGIQILGAEANNIHTLTADSTLLTGGTHTATVTQVMIGGTIGTVA